MRTRIRAESSVSLMVDMQERLLPAIAGREPIFRNSVRPLTATRDCGALAVPAKAAACQMLGSAETPQFKALLPLFK